MLTIAITSHNRGKYLSALLTSLREPIKDLRAQVIVVDNFSTEPRIQDVLSKNSDIIDEVVYRSEPQETQDWINDEYIAKNELLKRAKFSNILFLQDDLQFIGPDAECIEKSIIRMRSTGVPCLTHTAVRRVTTTKNALRLLDDDEHKIWISADQHYATTGFFLKEVTDALGLYPTNWQSDSKFWGASEDYYDNLVKKNSNGRVISSFLHVP